MTAKTTHYQSFTPQSTNTGGYRYFFNGQEGDNEVYENGAFQNYGFRMYDTRIARFWGVDPLTKDYPMLTPFQFASCSPILCVDVDGLEGIENTRVNMEDGVVHTYFNARQSSYVAPKWFAQSTLTTSELQIGSGTYNHRGEIKVPKPISRFELWLEAPADNFNQYFTKGLFNCGYSLINAPYIVFFNKTIAGASVTPPQRMDALFSTIPSVLTFEIKFSGDFLKTGFETGKGLQGYNKFVQKSKEMGTFLKQSDLAPNLKWQTEAGRQFKVNKLNFQASEEGTKFLQGISILDSYRQVEIKEENGNNNQQK